FASGGGGGGQWWFHQPTGEPRRPIGGVTRDDRIVRTAPMGAGILGGGGGGGEGGAAAGARCWSRWLWLAACWPCADVRPERPAVCRCTVSLLCTSAAACGEGLALRLLLSDDLVGLSGGGGGGPGRETLRMRGDPGGSAVHKFSKQRMPMSSSSGGAIKPPARRQRSPFREPMSVAGLLWHLPVPQDNMKKPLLWFPPEVRACVYLCAVAGSQRGLRLGAEIPRIFLAQQTQLLESGLHQMGWAWTFVCLSFYILFTHAGWYVCTNAFHAVENATGRCVSQPPKSVHIQGVTDRGDCQRQHNGVWLGFDISGHVFLLTWCNLRGGRPVAGLDPPGRLLREETETGGRRLTAELADRMWRLYSQRHTFAVRCSAICLSCLSLLWDLMLCITVAYFHSMPSKLVAALCSVASWAVVYRLVLRQQNLSFVCPPGQSELKFISAPGS
uniref:FIT family protein n=1 Tax=Macrostomum lignano TaxID=282301 RepID=A0A1I8FDQ1_9PLAT